MPLLFATSRLVYFSGIFIAFHIVCQRSSTRAFSLSTIPPSAYNVSKLESLFEHFERMNVSPEFKSQVTTVKVAMFVYSFDSVNEVTMDIRLGVQLFLTWTDHRLVFPPDISNPPRVELNSHFVEKVWKPDLYFVNEKSGMLHDITDKNELVHIYANGTVLYSARVSLTLSCPMTLQRYPHDQQECPMMISIFGYTDDVVGLKWRDHNSIQFNEDIHLTQFIFNHHLSTEQCVLNLHVVGNFSCLTANIQLSRLFGFYFIQIYLPTILIVCLSWISFWLPPEATPARVSVGLITVLTLTTGNAKSRESLPHVSYITALDIWMSSATSFVFLAVLEYAIVNVLHRRTLENVDLYPENKTLCRKTRTFLLSGVGIDCLSRILFPLCFIIFQSYYWPTYL